MNSMPRTRGLCKAGQALGMALMHLDSVIDADEFPLHAEQLRRCRASLAALQEVRNEDRRAGLHRGGEPFAFRVVAVPGEDLDADLPEMPAATHCFPVPCRDDADF